MRLFIFLAMTCVTLALSINTARVYAQTVDDLYQASLPELKPNTITVSWSQPTTKENGDLLTGGEIGGYSMYVVYPDGTNETINLAGADTLSHTVIADHGEGDYIFALATYDINNIYGRLSDPVTQPMTATSGPAKIDFTVSNNCEAGATCVFNINNGGR